MTVADVIPKMTLLPLGASFLCSAQFAFAGSDGFYHNAEF